MSGPYYISTIKGSTRYYIAATPPVSGSDYYVQLINPSEQTKRVPSDLYIEGSSNLNIYTLIGQTKYYLNQNSITRGLCLNFASGNVVGKDFRFFENNPNSNDGLSDAGIKLDTPLYFRREIVEQEYISNLTCNILTSHITQPSLPDLNPRTSADPSIYQFYISNKP